MVGVREIPRTAIFAWSPGTASPLIATGTRAGAVDFEFSNETNLELWDLELDRDDTSAELQPVAKFSTDSGFNDVAWTESDENNRGVIAGALNNGSLDLWDADKLLSGASDSLISRTSKHSGAIKALQFNPRHPNLLATGGAKGELFISDLNNVANPFRLGHTAARTDDIDCLDWNKKVAHIMVTGTSAGFVTVWDVKTKKESLTLNNLGRKAVSAVAWDPDKPTKLITSTPLESDPLILVWDLRNSHAPERVLRGHESGVLSLSWCAQDPDLLLSSGKDNRTVCWNPQTGEPYGEFPIVTNWTFQTRWNPSNPNFFATASFDGKISIQTIQSLSTEATQTITNQNQALDGEDFFTRAQTQPQVSTFSLPKTPKWLERPVSVSFGFGGRVVSVGLTEHGKRSSKIKITPFEVDSAVTSATESFENALKAGDLRSICESRVAAARSEDERTDWKVIETLISDNPRKGLVEYLGLSNQVDETADGLAKLELNKEDSNGVSDTGSPSSGIKKHKRITSIFDTNTEGDSFLSDLAASKGARTNDPFPIYTGLELEADKLVTKALLLGQFDKALEICLQEDRMSDAFMIAICGGQKCIEKVQEVYFSKQSGGPNYLRLLACIVGKNLWDVVHNADLSNWKEIMAVLCTFADEGDFPDLCEALGDRLEENIKTNEDKTGRKDASFCYLAGSKLEKVVAIWIDELREHEKVGIGNAADDSSFSIHVRALQNLIEKVTIFRQVTNYQDKEQHKDSDWKLSVLYEKYVEYADVVATHGRLDVAEKYLDLVPANHPEAELARNRVKLATKKAAPKTSQISTKPALETTPQPIQQQNIYQPTQSSFTANPAPTPNQYVPPTLHATTSQQTNPYASFATGGYTPAGYQPQPIKPPDVPAPPQSFGARPPGPTVPPPPRGFNQSPAAVTSYTTATNLPAWNDLPEGFGKPASRRGTPSSGGVISSPFPNQPQLASQIPSPVGPPVSGQKPPVAQPPPPPPRMMSPPSVGPPRPSSVSSNPPLASNPYSIPTQPPMVQGTGIPQRGPSPYNPPLTGAPPSNRYAPNPSSQTSTPQLQARAPVRPPPSAGAGLSYTPQQLPQQLPSTSGSYVPTATPHVQHPPQPAAQISRPSTAQSQTKPSTVPPKYPPGDRSHIPAIAMPIFQILSADMQRVRSRAPASFKVQVDDAERRLDILFDHLNNEDLLKSNTVVDMVELAKAMQARDYERARNIHLDILTNRTDECTNWMVGVKRLISMSKATP
ncbi:hypothetical protein Egran_00807 [Elaphomyces granulatus]|uniref:Protein transport protein SEC31 n=1 Tax=Elaphomyces granulatus TaxID=519963 RepID=A0A232M4V6_9EURO|nr:hypothetical protein Egran_00807 [Elaphomyces granulatus]